MVEIADVMRLLEAAQDKCLPGRSAVERDSVLRELWRQLQPQRLVDHARPVLRLCYTAPGPRS
jgi:hypothetical protein